MKMKLLRLATGLMGSVLFLHCGMVLSDDAVNNIEAVVANIKKLEGEETDIEKKVVLKIYQIKETVDNYSSSEKDLKGFNGLGRIEILQLKAERYAIERRARKLVEKDVMELIQTMKLWEKVKVQIKKDKKLLSLQQKIVELETNVNTEQVMSLNKENIEYFTVKKDLTLKQISAQPEVYGNEDNWKYLYEANKDKMKGPTAIIKAGTTLIVPDMKEEDKFGDL